MYKDKKIVVVSPVGRRESMGHLFKQVLKHRHVVDEHHLWVNTTVQEDLDFINQYAAEYPSFVHLKYGHDKLDPAQMGRAENVKRFYNYCVEKDAFYFKADDDIIYIEPGTFEKLAQYKLDNPETFLTFPTIINNHWCTHFLRKLGKLNIQTCHTCDVEWYKEFSKVRQAIIESPAVMSDDIQEPKPRDFGLDKVCLSDLYWGNPMFAASLLSQFKSIIDTSGLSNLDFESFVLDYEPVSINFIMWAGEDFSKFSGDVKCVGDEMWLNLFYPLKHGLKNALVGNTRVVHYAYYAQREFLNTTNILDMYKGL